MAYDTDNLFAKIIRREIPSEIIYEDDDSLVFMDVMPQSVGHALVIPKAPSEMLLTAAPETLSLLMPIVQKIAQAAMKAFEADGVVVQQFNYAAAGQTIFHTHFHIVPAYEGVELKRHNRDMADADILKAHADKYRAVL